MHETEPTMSTEPPAPPRRNRPVTALVGAAAIAAMLLVGLGVAGAQTEDAPPSTPPAGEDAPKEQDPGAKDRNCKRRHAGAKMGLKVAAGVIGIDVEALRAALTEGEGKSIAQVARDNGVDPAKVVEAIVAEAKTRLDAKVAVGDLTQERADQRLQALQTRAAAAIERRVAPRGEGCARHRCHGGHDGEAGQEPGGRTRNVANQPGVINS